MKYYQRSNALRYKLYNYENPIRVIFFLVFQRFRTLDVRHVTTTHLIFFILTQSSAMSTLTELRKRENSTVTVGFSAVPAGRRGSCSAIISFKVRVLVGVRYPRLGLSDFNNNFSRLLSRTLLSYRCLYSQTDRIPVFFFSVQHV